MISSGETGTILQPQDNDIEDKELDEILWSINRANKSQSVHYNILAQQQDPPNISSSKTTMVKPTNEQPPHDGPMHRPCHTSTQQSAAKAKQSETHGKVGWQLDCIACLQILTTNFRKCLCKLHASNSSLSLAGAHPSPLCQPCEPPHQHHHHQKLYQLPVSWLFLMLCIIPVLNLSPA